MTYNPLPAAYKRLSDQSEWMIMAARLAKDENTRAYRLLEAYSHELHGSMRMIERLSPEKLDRECLDAISLATSDQLTSALRHLRQARAEIADDLASGSNTE